MKRAGRLSTHPSSLIPHPSSLTTMYSGVIERYREYLPVCPECPVVSLNEGNTPLVRAPRLAQWIGGPLDVYLKLEGMNPTCSFKDRGMTVAVSKAVQDGMRTIMCA